MIRLQEVLNDNKDIIQMGGILCLVIGCSKYNEIVIASFLLDNGSGCGCPSEQNGVCVMNGKGFNEDKPKENTLFSEVRPIILSLQRLAKKATQQYSIEVDAVIREQSHSRERIEHLLDGMLDYCFDDGMLILYKKLCRYYFPIAPDATATYIYAYRDMWDTEKDEEDE